MAKMIQNPETIVTLPFPMRGIDTSLAFQNQRKNTTPLALNVQAFDPTTDRARGGCRGGLTRFINARVSTTNSIQLIDSFITATSPSTTTFAVRSVKGIAVAGGDVATFTGGVFSTPTNGTAALSSTAHSIQGVYVASQGVYIFADGVNHKSYTVSTDTIADWSAIAGSIPVGSSSDYARLMCLWGGRLVHSGIRTDPTNWFMSAVGSVYDYDYSPTTTVSTQAVAGNNSDIGKVPDIVTALMPFNDDVLFFGGDSTIWKMAGDPMAGGQLLNVSRTIGVAWGKAWCRGPDGTLFFFSSRGSVMAVTPESAPMPISSSITDLIRDTDLTNYLVTMSYEDRSKLVYVFITQKASGTSRHYVWDMRLQAWYALSFYRGYMNPKTVHTYDGDDPDDRVMLIGSYDGYIRYFSESADDDDGEDIQSEVWLGPILTQNLDENLLKDVLTDLSQDSGDVTWSVHCGRTAEEAYEAAAFDTGTWYAGRNPNTHIRAAGHAIYLKLTSTARWEMEAISARVQSLGMLRRRAFG